MDSLYDMLIFMVAVYIFFKLSNAASTFIIFVVWFLFDQKSVEDGGSKWPWERPFPWEPEENS